MTAYAFVPNCQQAHLKANINGQEVSTIVSCPELLVSRDDDLLHKLTAKALIDDWQYGILCSVDSNDPTNKINSDLRRLKLKEKIISLSVKYSITSEYTSFLAIEDRSDEEKRGKTKHSTTIDMNELLSRENIDILPYMAYDKDDKSDEIDLSLENQSKMSQTDRDIFFEFLLKNKDKLIENEAPTSPISLRYALLLSNEYKRKGDYEKASKVCKEAFDSSIAELDCLSEDSYKEVDDFF